MKNVNWKIENKSSEWDLRLYTDVSRSCREAKSGEAIEAFEAEKETGVVIGDCLGKISYYPYEGSDEELKQQFENGISCTLYL